MNADAIGAFERWETPFYYYDLQLLEGTLKQVVGSASKRKYKVHYALKANANPRLLTMIAGHGLGADCVSGNEIRCALDHGFAPETTVFAGIGKTDQEIRTALEANIAVLNCESIEELKVVDALGRGMNCTAAVALRINPDVAAETHAKITTGLAENKFGIGVEQLPEALEVLAQCPNLRLEGLHFHIGSQIIQLSVFANLCQRINAVRALLRDRGVQLRHLNAGGGLGVNYENPQREPIPNFEAYFGVFERGLALEPGQELHFELGRSIVAQCGSLVSRVLYTKEGAETTFAIVDAGMTELLRPALYQSEHRIEALTCKAPTVNRYDVVGPICETSDTFGRQVPLPHIGRGNLLAIRTCGAYGEVMTSRYNLRDRAKSYFSTQLTAARKAG